MPDVTSAGNPRGSLIDRHINILSVVVECRGLSTEQVMNTLRAKHGDYCAHRTVYRALQAWELAGFIRREPSEYDNGVKWIAMSRIVRVSYDDKKKV